MLCAPHTTADNSSIGGVVQAEEGEEEEEGGDGRAVEEVALSSVAVQASQKNVAYSLTKRSASYCHCICVGRLEDTHDHDIVCENRN